jgi:hypothetical protein
MTAKQIAALGWVSLFLLTWMFILGTITASVFETAAWVFFLIVAVFGESAAARKPADKDGKR